MLRCLKVHNPYLQKFLRGKLPPAPVMRTGFLFSRRRHARRNLDVKTLCGWGNEDSTSELPFPRYTFTV